MYYYYYVFSQFTFFLLSFTAWEHAVTQLAEEMYYKSEKVAGSILEGVNLSMSQQINKTINTVNFIIRIIQSKIKLSYLRQYSDLSGCWSTEDKEFDSRQEQ